MRINISHKSKYNKYLIDNDKIFDIINKYIPHIVLDTSSSLMTPVTNTQQFEYQYVIKRENYINFISYSYPEIQGTCVDFIVNEFKVQEKVSGYIREKDSITTSLMKNNGKKNGKRNFIPYEKGDNDFYWIHSSIDDRFWIIPENVLINKEYINNKIREVKKHLRFKCNYSKNSNWLKEYEYNYTNIDINKIKALFNY